MSYQRQKSTTILPTDGPGPGAFFAEQTRQNDIANAWRMAWCAGSRTGIIEGSGVVDADEYLDFRINGGADGVNGYTFNVIVELRSEDGVTTIEPQLYDVTAAPALVATTGGSPTASTTWTRQVMTIASLPGATKFYRVRANKVGTGNARMIAYLETIG